MARRFWPRARAQRAQPGLITLFTQESVYHVTAAQLQSVMVDLWTPDLKLPDTMTAVLVGPGLAAPGLAEVMTPTTTRRIWRDSLLPVVVDASTLDWLPMGATARNAVRVAHAASWRGGPLAQRATSQQVQMNRPQAVREISRRYGNCWVVLKGHQTLVGRSEGEIFVNPSGNPHLAQGGSGDALAGYLAGLLAQRPLLADVGPVDPFCRLAARRGGRQIAGGRANWVVEDLIGELGNAR